MKTSPTCTTIARALMLAMEQIGPIAKESWNPDTKSRYVSFNIVAAVVRPVLHANGILLVQGCREEIAEGFIDVETTLLHAASGEWIANMVRVPLVGRRSAKAEGGYYPPDPQAGGSALSYGKRYGVLSLLFLVADEDDDGQGAKPRTAEAVTQAREAQETGQAGERLIPGIMPVGGKSQKGKPIADMPVGVLRSALQHCREHGKRNEARIIAAELTRRSLGGDHAAEETIRAESRADENIADAAEEARQAELDRREGGAR